MNNEFKQDFTNFSIERVEHVFSTNTEIRELNKKIEDINRDIMVQSDVPEVVSELFIEHEDTYSKIISLHINDAYLQGMRDAYSLMEMLKGGQS